MTKSRAVLIVDDDPEVVALLAAVMRAEGFEVQTAKDGIGGIVELQVAKFAAILLDLHMPNFDGMGVIRYLHKHHREILRRVIVITADAGSAEREELLGMEIFGFFEKPCDLEVLAGAVRDCAMR